MMRCFWTASWGRPSTDWKACRRRGGNARVRDRISLLAPLHSGNGQDKENVKCGGQLTKARLRIDGNLVLSVFHQVRHPGLHAASDAGKSAASSAQMSFSRRSPIGLGRAPHIPRGAGELALAGCPHDVESQ
jgi:hypothetical protein